MNKSHHVGKHLTVDNAMVRPQLHYWKDLVPCVAPASPYDSYDLLFHEAHDADSPYSLDNTLAFYGLHGLDGCHTPGDRDNFYGRRAFDNDRHHRASDGPHDLCALHDNRIPYRLVEICSRIANQGVFCRSLGDEWEQNGYSHGYSWA